MPQPKRKSLSALMRSSEAAADAKPRLSTPATPASQQLVVKSISLTPAAEEVLTRLMQETRTRIGRKVSASSAVRALLDHCDRNQLYEIIGSGVEAELNAGSVIWGSRRGS